MLIETCWPWKECPTLAMPAPHVSFILPIGANLNTRRDYALYALSLDNSQSEREFSNIRILYMGNMCGTRAHRITFKRTNKSREGKMKVCDEKFAKRWWVERACVPARIPHVYKVCVTNAPSHAHGVVSSRPVYYSRRQPKNKKKVVCVTARAQNALPIPTTLIDDVKVTKNQRKKNATFGETRNEAPLAAPMHFSFK